MGYPARAITDLVDFWPMLEGGGGVCYGIHRGIRMTLRRRDFCTAGLPLTAAQLGWFNDTAQSPNRAMYNGQGRVVLPMAGGIRVSGDEDGGITLLCRVKPRYLVGGCTPASTTLSDVMGAPGYDLDTPTLPRRGIFWYQMRYSGEATLAAVAQVNAAGTAGVGSGGLWLSGFNGPSAEFIAALRIEVISGVPQCQAFINGVAASAVQTGVLAQLPADPREAAYRLLTRFTWGDLNAGVGAIGQACLVCAALSDSEIAEFGSSLNDMEAAARATTPAPWLHCNGEPWLGAEPEESGGGGIERMHGAGSGAAVIASAGEAGRQTRRVHEYGGGGGPRRYRVNYNVADGEQVERIRQAIRLTRGGSRAMRWRHPIDDAAGASITGPRVRLMNDEVEIERNLAGNLGRTSVDVEYMDP